MQNAIESNATARRTVLKKEGCADIHFEMKRASAFHFDVEVNGKSQVYWKSFSPQQAMRGDTPSLSLQDAWDSCLAKWYPGYTTTDLEEM